MRGASFCPRHLVFIPPSPPSTPPHTATLACPQITRLSGDGWFDVAYDDGTFEKSVPRCRILRVTGAARAGQIDDAYAYSSPSPLTLP